MNILIVEDDILIAEMVKEMMIELDHTVSHIAYNLEEGISALKEYKSIDIAILDIQIGKEKHGFKIAQYINECAKIPFVFLTSYADRIIIDEALTYRPRAYLLKPFTKIELYSTLEIIGKQLEDRPKTILIKEGTTQIKLNVSEILYMKSDNVYLEIYTQERRYLVRSSLEKMLAEIDDPRIKRVQRSYAINVNKVESVNGQNVLIGHIQIPISRNAKDEIFMD